MTPLKETVNKMVMSYAAALKPRSSSSTFGNGPVTSHAVGTPNSIT